MKSTFRPTSVDDTDRVRQFLQKAFQSRSDAPFLDPALMAWKYWNRRDDWEEPRAYVMERNGEIVAHVGIYPVAFEAGRVRGIQMIDWASAKESPGAGLALLQKLDTMFDFIYSIGGSEMTRSILPAFGFVEYAHQWRAARPIRPLQQILTHQQRNWKLAPRLVRNVLWALPRAKSSLPRGWKSEEIAPKDLSGSICSQNIADVRFAPRPPGFFEYLVGCPAIREMSFYSIGDRQGRRGHFAIGVLNGQARVAGVWLYDSDQEGWHAGYCLAQEAATRLKGACEIVAAGTEGRSRQEAERAGFRIVGSVPVYLRNKKGKLTLPPEFQFQLSDDDSLFLGDRELLRLLDLKGLRQSFERRSVFEFLKIDLTPERFADQCEQSQLSDRIPSAHVLGARGGILVGIQLREDERETTA